MLTIEDRVAQGKQRQLSNQNQKAEKARKFANHANDVATKMKEIQEYALFNKNMQMYKDKQNLQKKIRKLETERVKKVAEGVQKQNNQKCMTSA